jgi:hypothetical protein
MRLLTQHEVNQLAVLSRNGVPVGLLELTATGLSKSILDAVEDFRDFLDTQQIHDYAAQPQGTDFKKSVSAFVLMPDDSFVKADASLYRPTTKQGDPRIWFSKLHHYANAGDVVAVAASRGALYVFNVSRLDLARLESRGATFDQFLAPFFAQKFSVVDELREALVAISTKGFIRSTGSADTTVGMLLETELGIRANSNRAPDYKGIEIKAARSGRTNRHNLFAKVPNWDLSVLKSSQQVLDTFGYLVEGRRQLYCTVAAGRPNGQGLALDVDESTKTLWETSTRPDLTRVLAWTVPSLELALKEKHSETFWVKADSRKIGPDEEFHFVSVEHTSNPIIEQLAPLVSSRQITMDHLNREINGRAAERGPIFKLRFGALDLLFPPSSTYSLTTK